MPLYFARRFMVIPPTALRWVFCRIVFHALSALLMEQDYAEAKLFFKDMSTAKIKEHVGNLTYLQEGY